MKLKFKEIIDLLDKGKTIKLKTPFGYDKIVKYYKKVSKGYRIIFNDISHIDCGINHLLLGRDNELKWIPANQLKVDDIIYGENYKSYKKIIDIIELPEQEWIDFEMKSKEECYIQNDITHHNSGKSLTQAIISLYLAYKKNKKVVLIVPNVSLVKQFESDFREYLQNSHLLEWFENNFHTIYSGKVKHFEKPITLTTWQSIYKSEELFENVDCIIVDEVQQAKNMEGVLNDILVPYSINTEYKLGFTGSIPKGRISELTLIGAFGKINRIVSTKDLIDRGFGTPIEVIIMMLNYPEKVSHYITQLSYVQEKKFINNYYKRNEYIKNLAIKVTEKFGNSLVLFDNIEQGYNLVEQFIEGKFLPKITPNQLKTINTNVVYTNNITSKTLKTIERFNDKYNKDIKLKSIEDENIYFVYGEVNADDRELIRKKVESKDKVIIIANYKTFSVGINIKNLHNLILASSTKGFERIVQSLGRTIRKLEGKNKVRIWDIVDNFSKGKQKNYAIKHLEERVNIYMDEEHPIKQKDINFNVDIDEFKLSHKQILNIKIEESKEKSNENNISKIFDF